jgi:hypothetical protein
LKSQARKEEVSRFAGEHDAGAVAPLGIAANVAGESNVSGRVQRRGWFAGEDGF